MVKKILLFSFVYVFSFLFILPSFAADGDSAALQEPEYGGYIAMDWDRHVDMTDEDISFEEALDRVVDENTSKGGILRNGITDYTPRENIPDRFPCDGYNGVSDYKTYLESYLRDKYPYPRSQRGWETCWAFASVGLAEFYQINLHNKNKDIDYSEKYLAYGIYKNQDNQVVGNVDAAGGVTWSSTDRALLRCGGSFMFAAQFLSKGFGFINESDLPYDYSTSDNLSLDVSELYKKDVAHLSNVYQLDMKADNGPNMIKEAIMRNGIVGISYYTENSGYNSSAGSYYNGRYKGYPEEYKQSNHAVTIVGWDDNFDKSNFNPALPRNYTKALV